MNEQQFWDLAFVTIAGIQFHPANGVFDKGTEIEILQTCASAADEALAIRRKRCQSLAE